jgi:hypothetical protein
MRKAKVLSPLMLGLSRKYNKLPGCSGRVT